MISGAPFWIWPAAVLGVAALGVTIWSYRRPNVPRAHTVAAGFKLAGFALLLLCLTEPLVRRVRARPGANQLLVVVDDSRSLSIRDADTRLPRADALRELLAEDAAWQLRAGQDFDLLRYAFDARLRALASPDELTFTDSASSLAGALERLAARSTGRPVAGIVLLTDGISTDRFADDFDWTALPPVHVVPLGGTPVRDLALARLDVSQTHFEATPVTISARVTSSGCAGEPLEVALLDEEETVVERQQLAAVDGEEQQVRFHAPREASGLQFYSVRVGFPPGAQAAGAVEATEENNTRWAVVDRGGGVQRVLYVSGRPNWEFKFLRRAMEEDGELDLVGLLRIARSQPKFAFRDSSDRRNALWGGFEHRDEEVGEQYDEPVLLRLGTRDEFELRAGFPTTAEELFAYDGLIVDDLEAAFFTPDQQALIEQFVARRGAGFLMLGGEQSFLEGGYRRTPLGDLLPVYLQANGSGAGPRVAATAGGYALDLTREGWLEPWVRLRSTEALERERLAGLPAFRILNRVGDVKPGGMVLIEAAGGGDSADALRPALVAQRFGRGRTAAMLVGDLWRWDLPRAEPGESDLGTAWRQVLRWLVADVPRPVELLLTRAPDSGAASMDITLRDAAFEAVHDARVSLVITPPTGEPFELQATPDPDEAGKWRAGFQPREAGPYRARLSALGEDGDELGTDEAGWVAEPGIQEFRRLEPDREVLAEVARRTNGSVLAPGDLTAFAAELASREVPITEEQLDPLWHRWWVFLLALACFCVEWGVRRYQGLP